MIFLLLLSFCGVLFAYFLLFVAKVEKISKQMAFYCVKNLPDVTLP